MEDRNQRARPLENLAASDPSARETRRPGINLTESVSGVVAATRRLAAIMFTDMVGYTASTQSNEARTLELLRELERLVRPLLKRHKGREIKSTGDGFLVEFDSALKAVQCGVDIQRRIYERNSRTGVTPFQIRIGIHLGDVEQRGTDILGDAVNIAARIEPVAEPAGICVSDAVHQQVWNKLSDKLEKLPPKALKGLQVPVDIYRVVLPWKVSEAPPGSFGLNGLAVLPFTNISPDPKDEYFADGLTEELITVISHIRELRVIARTSVMQYKSTAKPVSQIGAELCVSSILEGSVRKAGNRLRITAQLIDVGSQGHAWAATYDRELDDVFAIQTEIAEKTAEALRLELLGPRGELTRKKPTSNLAAYDLYLQGLHAAHQQTIEARSQSIPLFEEAIRKDPEFSLAYSHLANMYLESVGSTLRPHEAFPRAKKLVAKALELDSDSSDAHAAAGNLAYQQDLDWAVAEAEFKRAISLNPSNVSARWWYTDLLMVLQRYDEAKEENRMAIQLDPLWEAPRIGRALIDSLSGDIESAIARIEEILARSPGNYHLHSGLGWMYLRAGRKDAARKEAEILSDLPFAPGPDYDVLRRQRASLWAVLGKPEEARRLINEWEEAPGTTYVNPVAIAAVHAALGEKDEALKALERAYREGERWLPWAYSDAVFDSIRDNSRFRAMLEKLNLPTDVKWVRAHGQ